LVDLLLHPFPLSAVVALWIVAAVVAACRAFFWSLLGTFPALVTNNNAFPFLPPPFYFLAL